MLKLIFTGLLVLQVAFSLSPSFVSAAGSRGSRRGTAWKTLSGAPPLVVARGGFSGLVPDSSQLAYALVPVLSLPNTAYWCDVQLTKDGVGVCLGHLNLANGTTIADLFPKMAKTYNVNGVATTGYFPIDYSSSIILTNLTLVQSIFSRQSLFDNSLQILRVEAVQQLNPAALWLNVQHDLFFTQHNLSMRQYIISASKTGIINYISSPELGFLQSIASSFKRSKTKLIFRFLDQQDTDPSTNQTYALLLKNLTAVKAVASGILVPKSYIWPTSPSQYLLQHTSLVTDAHNEGLEVFASDFANDVSFSYNYSYDPVAEYLSFINNSVFSVDGMLTDFPVTASAAIGCFSQSSNTSGSGKPLIISHGGSSGIYPSNTDLAYQQAVKDGANIIDCSVQITKDGFPICLNSADLSISTTVTQTDFSSRLTTIEEVQSASGIFTFDLTLSEIQTLAPVIRSPYSKQNLFRNPAFANAGRFWTLPSFLNFTKDQLIGGILINIENAAYLAKNRSISMVDVVNKALSDAGYNNQTKQKVMIQSKDSAVLVEMKKETSYNLVYKVDEVIGSVADSAIEDIKKFAHAVALQKGSIITDQLSFSTGSTDVIQKLHKANISAYVYPFHNEFTSIPMDFFSDPNMDMNAFIGVGVDGLITDYPATAKSFLSNACYDLPIRPPYIRSPQPGALLSVLLQSVNLALPPAEAPTPSLTDSNVVEAPLPPVSPKIAPTSNGGMPSGPGPATSARSGAPQIPISVILYLAMFLLSLSVFF
ncbi:glycerophosphodiester phosphodiesterase GDPDL3-like [Nymphaea colorata]|nr:glycerophosphodiester phosphodiesterase GDPDL3-like [Nymphaea colorata]